MFKEILSATILFGLALAPASADPIVAEEHSSSISIKEEDGAIVTRIVNSRYDIGVVVEENADELRIQRMLVAIESERSTKDAEDQETETLESRIRATARPINVEGLGEPSLSIDVPGDAAATSDPFLVVTTWGCCAFNASYAVYSLKSGKRVFSVTGNGEFGDWITMDSSRRSNGARYGVAFVAPTMSDVAELGEDPARIATITYARETEAIQRVIVVGPESRDSDNVLNFMPSLSWVNAQSPQGTDHVFIDKEAGPEDTYDGMTLRLRLDDATQIDIPVEKDRLIAAKATLPKGYRLIDAP